MSYVKFLDYSKLYTEYELDDAMKQALYSGHLILQEDVEEFEKRFAKWLGVKYFVGLNSGTDALFFALKCAGVKTNDEVITVSHTFVATIQVIHHLGAKPILVDVGDDALMDMDEVAKKINGKTKAIIPVHLSGDMCDMKKLRTIIGKRNIKIIEDAAQAIGAERSGKRAGTVGTGCFSFYPAKILGTLGDAGGLATNDSKTARRVKELRNHGLVEKEHKATSYEFGWNSRLDNVWAAVLNHKLDYLDDDLKKREDIATLYQNSLEDLPIGLPNFREGRVWQDYIIRSKEAFKLKEYLHKNGVETLMHMRPNHQYRGLNLEQSLPKTEEHVRTSIRIPCNQFMSKEDVMYVIKTVRNFYEM